MSASAKFWLPAFRLRIGLSIGATCMIVALVQLVTCGHVQAASWTNKDGKSIEADFIRVEGNTVHLAIKGKTFKVPLDELDSPSQGYARFLHAKRKQWVAANASSPIINEKILLELMSYDARAIHGKSYLIVGHVESVDKVGSALAKAGSTKAHVKLLGGTKAEIDFIGTINNANTRLEIKEDKAIMLKAQSHRGSDGWVDFAPAEVLLQKGQETVIRAIVKNGRIEGTGLATSAEITKARLEYAQKNGGVDLDKAIVMERLKNRVEFLEMQLAGNAGTGSVYNDDGTQGTVVFEFTDAEKQAMRKELELLKAQIAVAADKGAP